MHGGAAVLQPHGQGTLPVFRPTALRGCIVLLHCTENQPKSSNSYCRGTLEGEMPKHGLQAYVPPSARLFRGDLACFYLVLAPGRRCERVDRCEQREPHPCYGGGCQAFRSVTRSQQAVAMVPFCGL